MLTKIVEGLIHSVFGMDLSSKTAEALYFFIYDTVKILLLLFLMISFIGFLRSFIAREKIKKWLAGKKIKGHFFASLFGATTPFCSCSSIPIFLGFLKGGVPLGVALSFLITSPLINEYLVVLMLGFFGWKITVLYVASGLFIGIVSGHILGLMKLEKYIASQNLALDPEKLPDEKYDNIKQRILFGLSEAKTIIKRLWLWIIAGVGLGAVIHNYIPREFIQSAIERTGFLGVPFAVLLGVPMYSNCAAIVPVAVALFRKGIPLGTALAFMMATSALSFPEAVILRQGMKLKLIAIFFGITTAGIILTGYIFNLIEILFAIR
ncbi:MAG: permease [Candidatus Omnitrophica bacterium]|nr:permease [Candidatus Omnitrophota bacterium]MCF7878781.1 permease [Candidatus Omnitrophota bacterium]MCF7893322.1 permease [Candidatus Omnitrophota bacterium]